MSKRLFQPLVNRYFSLIDFQISLFVFLGKTVLIVNGAYRGQEATLEDIHQDSFSVDVTLLTVRKIRIDKIDLMKIRFLFCQGLNDRYSIEQYGV